MKTVLSDVTNSPLERGLGVCSIKMLIRLVFTQSIDVRNPLLRGVRGVLKSDTYVSKTNHFLIYCKNGCSKMSNYVRNFALSFKSLHFMAVFILHLAKK